MAPGGGAHAMQGKPEPKCASLQGLRGPDEIAATVKRWPEGVGGRGGGGGILVPRWTRRGGGERERHQQKRQWGSGSGRKKEQGEWEPVVWKDEHRERGKTKTNMEEKQQRQPGGGTE